MRVSFSSATALLLLLGSSGPMGAVVGASANAEPKPDTTPDHSAPTKTARRVGARETTPNLLSVLYQLASNFDVRACVPAALPLVTVLPKIPPALIAGDAISQALSQTTRELGDVCDFSITGTVGDTFTSFLPTWYSWYNRYSDRVARIVTKCPNAAALVRTVEAYETCPQVRAQISTATATASTGVGDGGSSDTDVPTSPVTPETTSTDSPGGAHETGFLAAAAAAAAGVLGVVAVL